jgi:hypothetical protein
MTMTHTRRFKPQAIPAEPSLARASPHLIPTKKQRAQAICVFQSLSLEDAGGRIGGALRGHEEVN